jgi:hypothetical protein
MKPSIFLSMALLLNPMLVAAQNTSVGDKPNDLHHERMNITGCLTKNSLKEFELVDQDAIDNLPYSAVVDTSINMSVRPSHYSEGVLQRPMTLAARSLTCKSAKYS